MCSSYSGPSGNGIQGYAKDFVALQRGGKPGASGGVSTGGTSGPSAAAAAGMAYMRRKQGAPILDTIFGATNG